MSNQADRRPSKRPAATADYERDDDFQFVRRSKRVKAEEPEPEPIKKSGRGRPMTKTGRAPKETGTNSSELNASATSTATATATTASKTTTAKKSSRRKPSIDASNDEAQLKEARKPTRKSARLTGEDEEDYPQASSASTRGNGRSKEKTTRTAKLKDESRHETSVESAKIALPMSDTPIINRNKEMRRKGNTNRRSSLGSRGRRASSLIENGQTAIPHRQVDPAEFYKHISEGLPEPRRMKQLLTWCGERALVEKPPHGTPDASVIQGARAIQDQLLKEFASRSEFCDWFSRDDDVPTQPVILNPNPRNIELDEKMATLEKKVQRLQDEKKAWLAIRKLPPEQPPLFTPDQSEQIILPDFDLLDEDDGRIRRYLADDLVSFDVVRSETEARLRRIQSSLEFEVDQFADNMHKLEQRVAVAGKEADKVLHLSAQRLRERDEREKRSAGTKNMPIMEVLRSLGSILPEGG